MEKLTQNYNDPVVAQQAKNLTKAIFQTESGGDFTAKGKSNEYGAGQWIPETWKAHAKDVLGDENAPMTPSNQSVVAQGTIRKLIGQGKNAAQIAAIWNSGSDEGWENKIGTNKYGVKYDVPKYVKSVTDAYQTLKAGGQVQPDPNNPSSIASTENANAHRSAGEAPLEGYSVGGFLGNIAKSGGEVLSGIGQAITHPIDTLTGIGKTAIGAAELLVPGEQGYEENARAVGKFFADRYGGIDKIKNSLYNDPVGVALDLSTLLGGAGVLAKSGAEISDIARASKLAKAGISPEFAEIATAGNSALYPVARALSKASEVVDPFRYAGKAVKGVIGAGGKAASGAAGITTGSGREAVKSIYQAGKEGGDVLEQTTQALRGKMSAEEVLQNTQKAVGDLRNQRQTEYLGQFNKIVKDVSKILPFDEIAETLKKQLDSYKIKIENGELDFRQSTLGDRAAQNTVREIYNDIYNWKDLTPEGLDTLKRRLDSYYSPSSDARAFAVAVKSSVRDVLKNNISGYEKMTKGYEEATQVLKEAQSAVGSPRMTQEAALRRIRSIFRDTQKERLSTVGKLEQKTGKAVKGQIAGLIMNPKLPEGLQKFGTEAAALGLATGHIGLPLTPGLLATSPRVVAETARFMGITARKLETIVDVLEKTTGLSSEKILQLLAQSGRIDSIEK